MASSADARPAVIFFDCDDCLYKNDWKVANLLTAKIESFCSERLQMREGYAYELYKKWGTCLRGMQQEGILDDAMVEEYLEYSHDVPLHEHIGPDPELRRMLESLDPSIPRWVFTASTVPHATRCLELLGVADLFRGVIDVRAVEWVTKHDPVAYKRAMAIAGVGDVDPSRCLFLDDSVSNMRAAKGVGWQTVLVGRHARIADRSSSANTPTAPSTRFTNCEISCRSSSSRTPRRRARSESERGYSSDVK